jgi:heptosyltransferase III
VLQAVPALRALVRVGRVTFAGQPRLGHLLAGAGVVDQAVSLEAIGVAALFAPERPPAAVQARLAQFDRVVSWFGSRADPYPAQLRAAVGDALLARPVPDAKDQPVWLHLLETLAPWGIGSGLTTPVPVPASWRTEGREVIARALSVPDRPFLIVHPGAGGAWKRWPTERFAATLRALRARTGCAVLAHEGPADAAPVAALERALGAVVPRLTNPELPVLAGALALADAYLGSDSGVSHLAASVGAPAVIVCPPGMQLAWAPWSPTAVLVEAGVERDDPHAVADLLATLLAGPRAKPPP